MNPETLKGFLREVESETSFILNRSKSYTPRQRYKAIAPVTWPITTICWDLAHVMSHYESLPFGKRTDFLLAILQAEIQGLESTKMTALCKSEFPANQKTVHLIGYIS